MMMKTRPTPFFCASVMAMLMLFLPPAGSAPDFVRRSSHVAKKPPVGRVSKSLVDATAMRCRRVTDGSRRAHARTHAAKEDFLPCPAMALSVLCPSARQIHVDRVDYNKDSQSSSWTLPFVQAPGLSTRARAPCHAV